MNRITNIDNNILPGFILVLFTCVIPVSYAQDVDTPCPTSIRAPQPLQAKDTEQARINADKSSVSGQTYSLKGDVVIRDHDKVLRADSITYDRQGGQAELEGHIEYHQPNLSIFATRGTANIPRNQASLENVEYLIRPINARGQAQRISVHNKTVAILEKPTYTTCSEDKQDWVLKAERVKLDQQKAVGYAKQVSLRFKNTPLLYLPSLSFPISDQRKSGLLTPRFGHSSKTGTDIKLPIYWNIAPNRDATFSLRHMSERGLQLNTQGRYLYRNGQGIAELEYLSDSQTDEDRYFASLQHQTTINRNWRLDTDLNYVSDQQYFDELGQNISISNTTHLPRRADLLYEHRLGYLMLRAHEYQAININPIYQRMPQVRFDFADQTAGSGFQYGIEGELTRFDHRQQVITGDRFDLLPSVYYEWRQPAYYFKPGVMLRHTEYRLDDPVSGQLNFSRSIPIFSADTGMFLERPLQLFSRPHFMTLEPRLFYLYAERETQNALPIFDTGLPDFRFAELFRTNRFSGPDRQSDANQLTLAVTSRLMDTKTGYERMRLSMGQVFYFEDRLVTLPGNPAQTTTSSDFVGELEGHIAPFTRARIGGQWDTDLNQANRANIDISYQRDKKHVLNIGYRYQRGILEQSDLTTRWKLSQNWHGIGRWIYSMRDQQSVDALAGLEYDTCCWSLQLVARRFIDSNGIDEENAFYIQLKLKGMTDIGEGIDDLLNDSILGYQRRSTVQ